MKELLDLDDLHRGKRQRTPQSRENSRRGALAQWEKRREKAKIREQEDIPPTSLREDILSETRNNFEQLDWDPEEAFHVLRILKSVKFLEGIKK